MKGREAASASSSSGRAPHAAPKAKVEEQRIVCMGVPPVNRSGPGLPSASWTLAKVDDDRSAGGRVEWDHGEDQYDALDMPSLQHFFPQTGTRDSPVAQPDFLPRRYFPRADTEKSSFQVSFRSSRKKPQRLETPSDASAPGPHFRPPGRPGVVEHSMFGGARVSSSGIGSGASGASAAAARDATPAPEVASSHTASAGSSAVLAVGRRVCVDGLIKNADMNGLEGVLSKYIKEDDKWHVILDGKSVKLMKSKNLIALDEDVEGDGRSPSASSARSRGCDACKSMVIQGSRAWQGADVGWYCEPCWAEWETKPAASASAPARCTSGRVTEFASSCSSADAASSRMPAPSRACDANGDVPSLAELLESISREEALSDECGEGADVQVVDAPCLDDLLARLGEESDEEREGDFQTRATSIGFGTSIASSANPHVSAAPSPSGEWAPHQVGFGPRWTIVGTWYDWAPQAMKWDTKGGSYFYDVELGPRGSESFQFLADGDWRQCVYPDAADAGPQVRHRLCGPNDRGRGGQAWTIGRHAEDSGYEGDCFRIRLFLNGSGGADKVNWELKV